MSNPVQISQTDRRDLVLGGAAATALSAWLGLTVGLPSGHAQGTTTGTAETRPNEPWLDAYRRVIGSAKPIEGRITFELPPLAENGNTVPFSVSVESPMTETDYVKTIHVLATANPVPTIATFRLSPQSGAAIVASRMRMAQSQDVIVLAEMSDGRFMIAKRGINVVIGGCGG